MAAVRPAMRMVRSIIVAVGALLVGWLHAALAFASVRMVPTTAHHKVNRKHHGGYDAK
jgi:hypothetical protein